MSEPDGETKFCSNCKKQISASNFMMHEMHCRRHISLCVHCKEPIPKGEMEVHIEESHASIACPKCGTEVEKMHLEDHEENSCPKKPTKCCYCELEFPRNEFDAHIDYCGSRTEQCPKCGQYIKLKDQTKHEDSKCRFPEVKPVNNGTNRADAAGINDVRQGNEYLRGLPKHPFMLDELSRAMRPDPPRREARAVANRGIENEPPVGARAAASRPVKKVKNATGGNDKVPNERQNARKKSDTGASPASDNEYQRLLAMHLAQDLNTEEEDLQRMMREFDKPSSPTISPVHNGRRSQTNTFSDDIVMIPCEFCGSPFMADDLVQHQSGCSLDRISAMLPQMANNIADAGSTNNAQAPIRSPIQTPEIINNLRPFDMEEWLDDTAGDPGLYGEDMLLPCEFCCDLFPQDTLIQHQAVCDSNHSLTPRVTTPAESQTRPKQRSSFARAQKLTSEFPNLSARHQQLPSGRNVDRGDVDDDNVPSTNHKAPNYTIGGTHRVKKPNISAANGINRNLSNNTNTNTSSVPGGIRQTMRKYGVESQDRGDHYTRPRNSSRQSSEADTDSWLQPSAQTYSRRESGSNKARNTLEDFLLDDDDLRDVSNHDLLGHIGAKTKRSDQTTPQQRMPGRSTAAAGGSRAKISSSVSKDGPMRDLGRHGTRATDNDHVQPRNRTSKPNIEVRVRPSQADELSDRVTGTQRPQRTRANNVFGGASNRPSRRRTDN